MRYLPIFLSGVLLTGCIGDSHTNKKDFPTIKELGQAAISTGEEQKTALRIIADLIAEALRQTIYAPEFTFDIFNTVNNPTTSINQLLNADLDTLSQTPTGLHLQYLNAECSGEPEVSDNKGSFSMDIGAGEIQNDNRFGSIDIPDYTRPFAIMTENRQGLALDVTFDRCLERVHYYDNDPTTSATINNPVRMLHGNLNVNFASQHELQDKDNKKDFLLRGTANLNNYFVQTNFREAPNYHDGNLSLTLATDDIDSEAFRLNADINLAVNNAEIGEQYVSNISVSGNLTMSEGFVIRGYDVQIGGSMSEIRNGKRSTYHIASTKNLYQPELHTKQLAPASGELIIFDSHSTFQHLARFSIDGVEFDMQLDAADNREIRSCTWEEIYSKESIACSF